MKFVGNFDLLIRDHRVLIIENHALK